MDNEIEKLVSKIKTLRPVSGRMPRWPVEIRSECVRLLNSGISFQELSKATGIWSGSLHEWQAKARAKNDFKEVQIRDGSKMKVEANKTKLFTLKFSTGPRIEDLTFEDLKFMKDAGLI